MKTWFYSLSSSETASVSEDALPAYVANGSLRPETLTWTDGMPSWAPARETLSQLFNYDKNTPPPLPPLRPATPPSVRSHEIDYEIFGDDMQLVEIELDPGETVIAEAGGMCYIEEDIQFESKMGDGSQPNSGFFGALLNIGKRMLTGESIFMTHFTHRGASRKRRVAFAAPYPGKIVPLKLSELGGEILCEKDAFLCAALGTSVSIAFTKRLGTGFFGGEGFILQRLSGDGMAFIHAGGTIIRRDLQGETLRVDTGCLVAMTAGIDYDIERAGNLKSMIFGGEGLFLATLRGHGTVWLQSLPFSRMADRILANAPSAGGKATGEGSLLGGLGRVIDGD
jgi:uncharacterized protein (TIGR00266 family)